MRVHKLRSEGTLVALAGAACALVLMIVLVLQIYAVVQLEGRPTAILLDQAAIVFYLPCALAVSVAGWEVRSGGDFGRAIARSLYSIGILLMSAALYATFAVPILWRVFGLTTWAGYGIFEPANLALGLIGLLLLLVGRLMGRAAELSHELSEFV